MPPSTSKRSLAALLGSLACTLGLQGGDLRIHTINVGWGLSVLIQGPTGKTFLLDGGDTGKGTSKIVPYLQAKAIASPLDGIVLSHNHADHSGGLPEVNKAGWVGTRNYYNGSTGGSAAAHTWVTGVGATALQPGEVLDLGGGATATCVVACGKVIGQTGAQKSDENDNSIALLVKYGSFSYLWEGDLGGDKDAQDTCSTRTSSQVDMEVPMINAISFGGPQALLPATGIDVIHVGHHGSQSSTHPLYVRKSAPKVAIISVGSGQSGTWALPYTQVVDGILLSGASGCAGVEAPLVLQTEDGDQNYNSQRSTSGFAVGNIVLRTDGTSYWVSSNSDNGDVPFLASGTLAAERQNAGIPAGTERKFTCKSASGTTYIALASFTAEPRNGQVAVQWVTGVELDTVGFHLWRSQEGDPTLYRLDAAIIPAVGVFPQGATYAFTDTTATPGRTWNYTLEDVDNHGASTFHGPVSARPGIPSGILSFQATPSLVFQGGGSLLSWTVQGSPALALEGLGPVTGSNLRVTPTATTPFTLVDGQGSRSLATVTVVPFQIADMAGLARAWGTSRDQAGFDPRYDLDGDGRVDDADVALCLGEH